MMSLLNAVMPPVADNAYDGHPMVLWNRIDQSFKPAAYIQCLDS